jgi:hypothetical protein
MKICVDSKIYLFFQPLLEIIYNSSQNGGVKTVKQLYDRFVEPLLMEAPTYGLRIKHNVLSISLNMKCLTSRTVMISGKLQKYGISEHSTGLSYFNLGLIKNTKV